MRSSLAAVVLLALLVVSALPVSAATNTRDDLADARKLDQISSFNVGPYQIEVRNAVRPNEQSLQADESGGPQRHVLGSVQSSNAGIGPGVSIDLTWADEQWCWGTGRQIDHWWNGATDETMEVSVHFAYLERPDTILGYPATNSGYNVYDAAVPSSNWPRGQDIGCDLQLADTLGGTSYGPSLAMTFGGRAVVSARGNHWISNAAGTARIQQVFVYYQGAEFNCTYDPRSALNVTWVDSVRIKNNLMPPTAGLTATLPTLATQWDGTNTIVHVGMYGFDGVLLSGNDYFEDGAQTYSSYLYFRKVGGTAGSGTWSAGQVIDSVWFGWNGLAAAPYPYTGVAVTYTNPTYWGALLDVTVSDMDVWCRESFDRGLTWPASYSITNYQNALAGDPAHFTAWLEAGCMFDSEGDLHAWWTAKPSSDDPYFDGFNWNDFDENVYHWEKTNDGVVPGVGDIVKVANGNFMNADMLTGSMNTFHCGFGGSNAGYLGWIGMGECDGKLYMLWSQIHERANRFPWRDAATQPAPGVLDDCSYNGTRLGHANWELMMSVAQLGSSTLWDAARSVSNTYTPDCGLPGDPNASGLCGSEWKVSVEPYALNETGLSLTWPSAAIVDLSPLQNYAGGWYLNLQYMDDQYPGPYAFTGDTYDNPPGTENSEKWIRLACVAPVEASQITVAPESIEWPEWVPLGGTTNFVVTVVNDGNVTLNVSEIGDNRPWLSHNVGSFPFQVTAGVVRTATFNVAITAPASPTQWLDGELWLKSDAANNDSVPILVHVLAAADVESVRWDTVTTHVNMFDEFFDPAGACVALGVGNNGDLGWGAGSGGSINLDYTESGLECGTRARDQKYLSGASAFTIMASATDGTGAELTQVTNDLNQADETGFDPTPAKTMAGGSTTDYDSVYTGKFVNRDTTIAFERVVYGPRSATPTTDIINFVVVHTWVYSADGAAHNHVTLGNVADWDVPADSSPVNTAGVSGGGFVYLQGTDTTGHAGCQLNTGRFATEAFGGGFTAVQYNSDPCSNDEAAYYSINALDQLLMVDTTHYRNGTDLIPDQPNPLVWWTETSVPGLNANSENQDQAIWLTYKYDYNLATTDTLHYWTVMSTVRSGVLSDLEAQVAYAKCWYTETIRGCACAAIGCCVGKIGDANGSGDDMPTIGDISVMIDAKFITGACIESGPGANIRCLGEADANLSGGLHPTCDDISIGDISMLIDDLFITGEPPFVRNNCMSVD